MSNFFTNSINQRSNTEKQSPIKIKSSTENKCVNGIQKVPQQNFGAYDTFDVKIDHILVHFVVSKLGVYVSFPIPL
jgi:hypothetical protein